MQIRALIGTDKGGFVLRSDAARTQWDVEGPLFKGWKMTAAARGPSGRFLAATASEVYGHAVHVSDDLETWRQIDAPPQWPESVEGRKLNQIWTLVPAGDRWYAGVDEAGLFTSDDDGETWTPVDALNEHATRGSWFPGAGGLCAHSVLVDPKNTDRIWCGISAVGVFRSEDGGATWHTKNEGIPAVIEDKTHKDIGRCVHAMVADPDDADLIYRREHIGMFRSRDGGETWERNEQGLASWFGFPISMDRDTRTLFCVPLESDEYRVPVNGALEVYRSTDGGDSWQACGNGLPGAHAYTSVLRKAMDVDHLAPCGVYFGTTSGTVYVSNDAGASFTAIPVSVFVDG
jgi:photosystem II stability/assembly factor-like uncharacterized protein